MRYFLEIYPYISIFSSKYQCLKRKNLSQSFDSKILAMKWKRDTESAVEQGKYAYDKPGSKNTLAELIDRYTERVLPSKPKTQEMSANISNSHW